MDKSPPAEKTFPAPVRIMAVIFESCCAWVNAAMSSPLTCGLIGLRFSGRLSVIHAIDGEE